MNDILLAKINSVGLNYKQYVDLTKQEIELQNSGTVSEDAKKRSEDLKLNLHRMTRIEKYYVVSDELKVLIQKIDLPQTWMIISETWCGDSAQNIPYIAKIADLNSKINLKIILRDTNPEIMDKYLTNGTRSIPILAALDEEGEELFKWGPRPQEAKQLIADLILQDVEKNIRVEKLHLWYGRNRGKNLEIEFMEILRSITKNNQFVKC